ncbi:MAG: BLUF domain-containing protein [Roseinatronobacter sp.]
MAPLRSCTYLSRSLIAPHSVDLLDIERAAVRNNSRNEITAFLYFDGTFFVQLIEGPAQFIGMLLQHLERDPRHIGMVILRDCTISQRHFATWDLYLCDGTVHAPRNGFSLRDAAILSAEQGDSTELLQSLEQFSPSERGRPH